VLAQAERQQRLPLIVLRPIRRCRQQLIERRLVWCCSQPLQDSVPRLGEIMEIQVRRPLNRKWCSATVVLPGKSGRLFGHPVPGHQFVDAVLRPAVDEVCQQIRKIGLRINVIEFADFDYSKPQFSWDKGSHSGGRSQRQPLVLLLEDLHWADAPSLGLLDALVEGLAAQRILVLATCRPEYRPAWAGRSGTTQVRLDPLPVMDAEILLQSLLGNDATLTMLRRRLAARAEGISLFLEEAVRGLAEAGSLSGTPGRYQLGPATPAFVELPPTITAVVAARIDRLPPPAKSLLQMASVIGREFPLVLLQHVSRLDPETLQTTLAELRAAEFLFESRLPPDTEYTFKHAMTQEAAYGGLLRDHRRALHVDLVHAIEHLYEKRLDEQVDRLAEHALAGDLWPQAVRYLLRAANRAIERSAHAPAADLLQRGLEAMRHLPETPDLLRAELGYRKALGVTMMALKGWGAQEVSDAYIRARGLSERLGDKQELFVVLCGQGQFYMMRGEPRTARALGERCTTLAENIP
jgi:predicted ATPase